MQCVFYGGTLPTTADASKYAYGAVTRTDWIDEIFRTGSLEHYALSLSGGSDNLKALASFNFDKDQGVLLNTFARKFGGKVNLDFKVNKYISFSDKLLIRSQTDKVTSIKDTKEYLLTLSSSHVLPQFSIILKADHLFIITMVRPYITVLCLDGQPKKV